MPVGRQLQVVAVVAAGLLQAVEAVEAVLVALRVNLRRARLRSRD